jgi:hypothetical protein
MQRLVVFRKVFFVLMAFLLTIHLSFTLVYNFEIAPKGSRISYLIYRYMFPFFNQNNKIFAPDPPFCKQQLLVKYKNKAGLWTRYQDLQATMLQTHVANRLSSVAMPIKHYDYILRQLSDANTYADYYMSNYADSITNSDSLKLFYLQRREGFQMAHRYFSDMINQMPKRTSFDSLQFKIVYIYPEKYHAKKLADIKASSMTLYFPVLPILSSHESAE